MDNTIIVSVITPVGPEFDGLDDCLRSFIGKAKEDTYEVIIGINEGDYKNIGIALEYSEIIPLKTFIWDGRQGYYHMHEKTNWLAEKAVGEFIWWLSDECRIITGGWVKEFIRCRKYHYQPTLIHPKTLPVPGAKYPAMNRMWYEMTGKFTGHPSLDSWLNTIKERANARQEIVDIKIREVERPEEQTNRGKAMGTGEEWNTKKIEKEINKEVKKIKHYK